MSCNEPILLSTEPDDIAILEGPGVQSVNGKVGKVVLDAGDFAYDDTKEYGAGSVGAELKELSQKEIDVDSALSDTSTNPVQNKVVKAAMDKKVTEEAGKGLSANDFTNAYKTKLDNIEEEANKTIVDSALSLTSENPVQNKVVTQEINDKADVIISTASGSIAHFEDGAEADAKSVIAHIEPVQDLHGYDAPWPAGGGKNLYDASTFPTVTKSGVTCTNNGDGSFTLNGTANNDTFFNIFVPQFREGQGGTPLPNGAYRITGCPTGGSTSMYYMYITPSYTTDYGNGSTNDNTTISGGSIFIKNGYTCNNLVFKPMIRTATNGDDTFTPYSNICPITGHTGMDVVRTGKNLIANKKVQSGNSIYLGTDIIGSPDQNYTLSINLPAGTYTLNVETADDSNTNIYVAETGIANAFARATNVKSLTFTLTKTTACRIWVYKSDYSSIGVGAIKQFQLERGSTATDYEPYQGETHPITFPTEAGTVYGGYVDVTNGKLVVDWAEVDLGTLNWKYDASPSIPNFWAYGFGWSVAPVINNNTKGNIICSEYETITANEAYTGAKQKGVCLNTSPRFFAYDQTYTSASTFKTAMSGVQLVYELANPTTYDITPQQIALLLGVNNVWNDANGVTDVTYKADTKLYIEQLTKPTEDDMTANANIASGKFFMVGNRLFLSTSAIASGDTINPGTNCTELSLADALNNLN